MACVLRPEEGTRINPKDKSNSTARRAATYRVDTDFPDLERKGFRYCGDGGALAEGACEEKLEQVDASRQRGCLGAECAEGLFKS